MTIFHFAYIGTLLLAILYGRRRDRKKMFCVITGLLYFAIASMRSSQVGFDTLNYKNMFNIRADIPLDTTLSLAWQGKDVLFYGLMAVLAKTGIGFNFFLALIAGFFSFTVWRYIYTNSEDPCLSIIFLLAFNLFQFSLSGLRQVVTMSFALLAFELIRKQKTFFALLVIAFASFFHRSILVLLILFVLQKIKLNRTRLLLSVAVLIIVFFVRTPIARQLVPLISKQGYEINISESGYTMAFVCFALYVMFVIFYNEYSNVFGDSKILVWMMFLACFFEMLVPSQNIFFRFAFYFLLAGLEVVPNISIALHNRNSKIIVRIALYILLSIQYLVFTIGSSGILPYSTFWND